VASSIAILFTLIISTLSQQPRPPHQRPPSSQLNYNCLADKDLPKFVPSLNATIERTLLVPQSDTTYYLMLRWANDFTKYYPFVVLNAPIIGSGIAGPCLANQSCDLSIIAREMLLPELELFEDAWGYPPFEFPLTGGSYAALAYTDAMTVIVHPTNPLAKLTFDQFDAIFSTTRYRRYSHDITLWGQLGLGGDWKDKPINLIGVTAPNGFEYFLNRTILLGGKWKDTIQTRETVFDLAAMVAQDPYSMGYTGLAFLNVSVNRLALSASGGWPYVGDKNYVRSDEYDVCTRQYPLSRVIYLYTNRIPGADLDPVIKEFLNYVLSYEGQKAVQDDMIFLPLPASLITQLRSQLMLS